MENGTRALDFFISCVPPKSTAQQKSIAMIGGKPRMYLKKGAQEANDSLLALMAQHAPEKPLEGPLRLELTWAYPWRKSEPKKNRVDGVKFCDTRPDCDNLTKLAADGMSRLNFWGDDSQVALLVFTKVWSDTPGITVYIEELGK